MCLAGANMRQLLHCLDQADVLAPAWSQFPVRLLSKVAAKRPSYCGDFASL
jgi:hypothetical protein